MEHTPIHDRVSELRAGTNPHFVSRLDSGWVVVSPRPLLPAHCILFADPVVFGLNDLDEDARALYQRDVARIGDALIKVTGAYRINYETMCNVAQALHTHVYPRQLSEPEAARRERPATAYKETDFSFQNGGRELIADLAAALNGLPDLKKSSTK